MAELDGARIVVTGGAGFIGSHLVAALLAAGAARVAVVDTFFLGKERNLDQARAEAGERLMVYREDAGDTGAMAALCAAERPDIVFNLATKALLYSFFNPAGACKVNLDIALQRYAFTVTPIGRRVLSHVLLSHLTPNGSRAATPAASRASFV